MEEAIVNITYNGQNGELPGPVTYDATEQEIKTWVAEALTSGIPGIDPVLSPDLEGYKVDRYPAKDDLPNRIVFRPKTEFGN